MIADASHETLLECISCRSECSPHDSKVLINAAGIVHMEYWAGIRPTYQDLQINCEGGHNEIHRLRWADDIIIKMMRLQKISLLSGRIRQPLEYPFNISTIASLKTLCPPLLCHFY